MRIIIIIYFFFSCSDRIVILPILSVWMKIAIVNKVLYSVGICIITCKTKVIEYIWMLYLLN